MMEHFASWGFVLMAPDHIGMTASEVLNEPDTFYPIAYTNPTDVSLVIDFAENLPADSMLSGMIDTERIASTGHSSGGMKALQVAGGQLDLVGEAELCADGLELNDCALLAPFMAEIAELYGLDAIPDGLYPSLGDDRVDAIIPLAPNQIIFGETGLNNVIVPMLYIVGNRDASTPYDRFLTGFNSLGSEEGIIKLFACGKGCGMIVAEKFQRICSKTIVVQVQSFIMPFGCILCFRSAFAMCCCSTNEAL